MYSEPWRMAVVLCRQKACVARGRAERSELKGHRLADPDDSQKLSDSFNSPPVWEGNRGEIVTVVHPSLLGNATSLHTSRRLPGAGEISRGREICRDITSLVPKITRANSLNLFYCC